MVYLESLTSFIVDNGQIRIHHERSDGQPKWEILRFYDKEQVPRVVLRNILFINFTLSGSNLRLVIYGCTFQGNSHVLIDFNNIFAEWYSSLGISHSTFDGYADCDDDGICRPSCSVKIRHRSKVAKPFFMENSTLRHTFVKAVLYTFGEEVREIYVRNSYFESGITKTPGGLHLETQYIKNLKRNLQINIENCTFKSLGNAFPLNSHNEPSALSIEILIPFHRALATDIFIRNCIFEDNQKALRVFGTPGTLFVLSDCLFRHNYLFDGVGAAVYLALKSWVAAPICHISNCVFEDNVAGYIPKNDNGSFNVERRDTSNVLVSYNGNASHTVVISGKGGAIALSNNQFVTIENSIFVNNSANEFGGTLYVISSIPDSEDGELLLVNCTLTSGAHISQHGNLVYSVGKLIIKSAIFNVLEAINEGTIVEHDNKRMSFYNFNMTCPIGKNFVMSKMKDGQYSDDHFDLESVHIKCVDCERGFYSFGQGHLSLVASNETIMYFDQNDVNCKLCPYGATCEGHIRSLPNYWGYTSEGEVIMERCPNNQCCSKEPCTGYDSCSDHREGLLCSECTNGFTPDLFKNTCIQSPYCQQWWFWPSALVIIIIWASVLLFRVNIFKQINKRINLFPDTESKTVYFILLVHFCQDVLLASNDRQITTSDSRILKALLFQTFGIKAVDNFCIDASFTRIDNLLVKTILGPAILLLYLYAYTAAHCLCKFLQRNTQNPVHYLNIISHFKIKIASAVVLVLILCFQPLAIAAFKLIHCNKIGGERVLRIDTSFSCFQIWQYLVLVFVAMWVLQFPFYITFLPILLQSNICVIRFYFA